jgi:hypothetical protein
MRRIRRRFGITLILLAVGAWPPPTAQVPQPFPGRNTPARPAPAQPDPAAQGQTAPPAPTPAPPAGSSAAAPESAPNEALLGFPIYPNAQFIASYDAGRGQRYYLFGSEARFPELVKYYQSVLKARGTLVFDAPAIHVFEIGRFREDTMAFPPGVTIKDYTWNGSAGYLNPQKNGKPARFPSVIQIVPSPGGPGPLR